MSFRRGAVGRRARPDVTRWAPAKSRLRDGSVRIPTAGLICATIQVSELHLLLFLASYAPLTPLSAPAGCHHPCRFI
ncbi:hypothetical protein SGPA1_11927 [Streptomyces misionensis JCM 4497]